MHTPEATISPSAYAEPLTRRRLDMRDAFGTDAVAIAQPTRQCRSRAPALRPDGPDFTRLPRREWSPQRLRSHCKGPAP
jgi:hypothetical protein